MRRRCAIDLANHLPLPTLHSLHNQRSLPLSNFSPALSVSGEVVATGILADLILQSPSHTVPERAEADELGNVTQLLRLIRTPRQHGVTSSSLPISIAPPC